MVEPDQFRIDFTGEYLHVIARGRVSEVSRSNARLDRIVSACAEHNCKHILLELHTEGQRSASDQFAAMNHLAELGYTSDYRMAVVDQRRLPNIDDLELAQTMGDLKGWNGKIFKSLDDAKAWLTGPA